MLIRIFWRLLRDETSLLDRWYTFGNCRYTIRLFIEMTIHMKSLQMVKIWWLKSPHSTRNNVNNSVNTLPMLAGMLSFEIYMSVVVYHYILQHDIAQALDIYVTQEVSTTWHRDPNSTHPQCTLHFMPKNIQNKVYF